MKLHFLAYGLLIFFCFTMLQAASTKKTSGYVTTFLQAADQLKYAGDNMMPEIKSTLKQSTPRSSQEQSNKKKEHTHTRFLARGKKKKSDISESGAPKNLLQKSDPLIKYKKTTVAHEQISDMYINALTFYNECCKTSSPITGMYIRMQMKHILDQLTHLYAPIDLFNPTTVFELNYKEIIMQSNRHVQEPVVLSVILNDVIKKHALVKNILQSNPNGKKHELLCSKLQTCMKALMYLYASNRIDRHHQIIVHAYTELTWRLLHKISESPTKTAAMLSLHNEWSDINAQPLNLQPLFDELAAHTKKNHALYHNPLVLKNPAFYNQLIQDQCNMLHHLLSLHRTHGHNTYKQYWLGKAADTIIKTIPRIPLDQKPKQQFSAIYQKWQHKHLNVITILNLIQKKQSVFPKKSSPHNAPKLQPEQTVAACFEMLPVLIDLYTEHAVPPALLKRITDPIETIISTLFTVLNIKASHLPPEQLQIITRATTILETTEETYTLQHILLKAERLLRTEKEKAKKAYIEASELIMHTSEHYDPIMRDRIYTRLLNLYECNTYFSPEDCITLQNFAVFINMPLPTKIKLQADLSRETHTLKSFLNKLVAQSIIEPQARARSSS